MKKYILLPLLLISFVFSSVAQNSSIGVYFNSSKAQGKFGDNLDRNPAGIVLKGYQFLGASNLALGAELGISMYSNQDYKVPIGNNEYVDVHEEDCYYSGAFAAQYVFFREATFSPYVVGKLGFSTFFSDVMADEETDKFESLNKTHGTSFNTMMGAGFKLNLSDVFNSTTDRPVYFDFSFSKVSGSKSKYRHIRNYEDVSLDLNYGKYESFTDHLDFHFGVEFTL
jgi:hypothetical protein